MKDPDEEVASSEVRERFTELMNRAAYAKERIVLTRHGKRLAAVVPIEDLETIEAIEDRMDLADAREALEELEAGGTIAWEDLKEELGL